MDVTGIRRSGDLPFAVPEALAEAIDALVDAMANDDWRVLDGWQGEVEGRARMLPEAQDRWVYDYYLRGGWRHDQPR